MSKPINFLSFDEALAVAQRIQATPEADLRRATTGLSFSAIASIAVLAVQLDAIARAAARLDLDQDDPLDPDAGASERGLAELLRAAGYLPLPTTPTRPLAQELTHGEG